MLGTPRNQPAARIPKSTQMRTSRFFTPTCTTPSSKRCGLAESESDESTDDLDVDAGTSGECDSEGEDVLELPGVKTRAPKARPSESSNSPQINVPSKLKGYPPTPQSLPVLRTKHRANAKDRTVTNTTKLDASSQVELNITSCSHSTTERVPVASRYFARELKRKRDPESRSPSPCARRNRGQHTDTKARNSRQSIPAGKDDIDNSVDILPVKPVRRRPSGSGLKRNKEWDEDLGIGKGSKSRRRRGRGGNKQFGTDYSIPSSSATPTLPRISPPKESNPLQSTTNPSVTSPYFTPAPSPSSVSEHSQTQAQIYDVTLLAPCDGNLSGDLREALRSVKPCLIQEHLASDPWKVIVATTLLNKTTGKAAIPVFWALMRQWGTPEALAEAPIEKLTLLLKPLGLYNVRARRLKLLSRMYVDDPPQVGVLRSPLRGGARNGARHSADPNTNTPTEACTPDCRRKRQDNARETCETLMASPCLALGSPVTSDSVSPTSSASSASNPLTPSEACVASSLASSTPHQTRSKARTRYPPTPISHLPGTGPYALDSYRIFCTGADLGQRNQEQQGRHNEDETEAEWKQVMPSDKELIRYLKWKWAYEEGEEWVPGSGVTRKISDQYLRALVADLRS